MKITTLLKYTFIPIFLMAFAGCDTWESNINENPNDPPSLVESDSEDYDPSQFMLDMIWKGVHAWDYVHWNVGAAVCEYHGKTLSLSQGNRHQA